jgi:DNA polymerase
MSNRQETTRSIDNAPDLTPAIVQQLESLRLAGVSSLPDVPQLDQTTQDTRNEDRLPMNSDTSLHESPVARPSDPAAALKVIQDEVAQCTQCTELAEQRNKTVFGVGNPQARLCFLGEAPGADEDRTGEPFVGRAGQLLTKIIEACTLTREDVYILNMLKCRPPGNRNPLPDEVANCSGFLQRQLEIIQPEYICCLGAVAAKSLLDSTLTIGKLRGKFHDWNGIKVLATYHPAYLLRNPSAKAEVWKDMQFLMQDMGIDLPKR